MSSRWHLDDECVDRGVWANHGDSSETVTVSSTHFDRWRESSNLDKIVTLINVLEVLSGYIDFIKLGMVEFVQVAAMLVEGLGFASSVQTSLVHVAPVLQSKNVFL
jgi:hypothetical protein